MRRSNFASPRSMSGISIVELMVGVTLGLLVLAGLASLFASSSTARTEMERNSRQIENGRFALDVLADELRLAGFYGELDPSALAPLGAFPNPCANELTPAQWAEALPMPLQGYDESLGFTQGCRPADIKPGSDVLFLRRAATCEAGALGCDSFEGARPYLQVSKCYSQMAQPNGLFRLELGGGSFDRKLKDCAIDAGKRRYYQRMYYLSINNGLGQEIPTLKRLEFDGAAWIESPLVEGIEHVNFEYGIDTTGDGQPDYYTPDPSNFVPGGCPVATCNQVSNWQNVVSVRVNLIARNIEPSPGYLDKKTYTLGRRADGSVIEIKPNDEYRRHAYTGLVRVVNVAQRREKP